MSLFMIQLFILVALVPVWFMLRRGRADRESKSGLGLMVAFGVLAVYLTFIISTPFEIILPETGNLLDSESVSITKPDNLLLGVVVFAAIEELAKFVPAAMFLYSKKYFNHRSDGVLYLAIVGLSFGVIENLLYLSSDGAGNALVRIMFGWFFHGALTSIAGYSLAIKKTNRQSWLVVALGLVIATGLHSAYNYGLFASDWNALWIYLAVLVSFCANAGLFVLFFIASRQDSKVLAVDHSDFSTDF
ncbi:PrsW family intramembrane metalloprotease [Candidatus Saccharibacteria bacterium]|nr:PrsW family intramembrane metalloprotease [Candidatus Saccharibacteria bacterium]MBP9131617.1 PrsW family intramembrane metalloprotease [Candidatus Saccharibacteria bacterium]